MRFLFLDNNGILFKQEKSEILENIIKVGCWIELFCDDYISQSLALARGILGLQPRDKAAMLVVDTKEIFLLNLHQNRVYFPAERNAFVLDHQHGRRDVTCKAAI